MALAVLFQQGAFAALSRSRIDKTKAMMPKPAASKNGA
jgi:hypothetical protein